MSATPDPIRETMEQLHQATWNYYEGIAVGYERAAELIEAATEKPAEPVCSCGHPVAAHPPAGDPREAPEYLSGPIHPCCVRDCDCREFDFDHAAQPPQDSEVSSEGLAGEIAHFRELAAGERREADRAVAGSSEESRYHGRATVYEHVVDRLRKLADHPDTGTPR